MSNNISSTFLLILWGTPLLIGIITAITLLVKSIVNFKRDGNELKLKYFLVSILCVIIALASWLMNFGWIRLALTFFAIPIIHTVGFMIISYFALSYVDKSVKLKRYIIFSCITYLLSYILLPDAGDIGSMYLFFSLIHNDIIANISYRLSVIVFIANIVLLILQIVERNKVKRGYNN